MAFKFQLKCYWRYGVWFFHKTTAFTHNYVLFQDSAKWVWTMHATSP